MISPSSRFMALFAALLLLCIPQGARADTKRFGITSYDRIEVRGDMIVDILPDYRISAVAEGTRAALETLSLEVSDRVLVVSQLAEGPYGPRRAQDGPIRLRLTAQNLASVSVRGAAQVDARGLRGRDVVVQVDGPGRIDATIPAGESVRTRLTGSGAIRLSGRAQGLQVNISGAGGVDASSLPVRDLTVRASGSGSSSFSASGAASVIMAGDGSITVDGRARCTVSNSGAGTVACGAAQQSSLPGS